MGLLKKINNRIRKYLLSQVITPEEFVQLAREKEIEQYRMRMVLGDGSKLYDNARVFNLQGQREQIVAGQNTHIRGDLLVFAYGGRIQIGDNCYVGDGSRIWSGEDVRIGNNVLIAHNVNIIDSNSHEMNYLERAEGFLGLMRDGYPKEKGSILTAPVVIGDYAWISFGSIILRGVTIGKGGVVAAGSVVTKDVPPFAVVAGNPAVVVKQMEIQ
ncbi:MAG TPA: acyltransferase [Bacteroidia bacterium]|nr:acyltransferase [Bacteroidia bacterium]